MKLHVVVLTEYEQGYGSKPFTAKEFESKEEALNVVNHHNDKLSKIHAPKYYVKAQYFDMLSDEDFNRIIR